MIQCNSFNKWIHYTCSMLPPYQVYIFVTSSRRYSCPNCVQIQDSFKYKSLSVHPTNTSIKNHVDNGTIPLTKKSSCQTNEHLKFDDKKKCRGMLYAKLVMLVMSIQPKCISTKRYPGYRMLS